MKPRSASTSAVGEPRGVSATSPRRVAVIVASAGVVVFLVMVWALVPSTVVLGSTSYIPDPGAYFSADEIARGEEYTRWARAWSLSALAVSLSVSALAGFTCLGRALVDRLPGPWWVRVTLAVATIAVMGRIATLPFAIALRSHALDYGLSTQSWGGFAVDLAVTEAVQLVVMSVALIVIVGAARRWRRAWPAVAGGVLAGAVVLGSLLYPLLIEPLSTRSSSLPDGELRSRIIELAEREGVEVRDVLVADASRRTTTLNAYVSGLGPTRRIVVYDTLVADLGSAETLSVLAHELAHAKNEDIVIGTSLGAAGIVFGVGLLGALVPFRRRTVSIADPGSIPLILALIAVATVLVRPVEAEISRRIETRADIEALRATDDPTAFIALQQGLARRSAADLTPPGWLHFWFGTHPTTLQRIANAERQGAG